VNKKLLLRKSHRYIALIVGVQLFFWSIGGLYFSLIPIDEIHGDHLSVNEKDVNWISAKRAISYGELLKVIDSNEIDITEIRDIKFKSIANHFYYKVILKDRSFTWINANTSEIAIRLTDTQIKDVALGLSLNAGEISSVEWLTSVEQDSEYREKALPAYRVNFNGKDNLHMYLDGYSGELISMRTTKWRIFDFLWMLHVMDYETRDNFNHLLLQFFAALAVFTSLTGIALWTITSRRLKIGSR